MSKAFIIGFHRTGTRSTNSAMQQLGWNIVHYPCPSTGELSLEEFNDGPPWKILKQYDGISDIVTIPYCKRLMEIYPNSLFILTIRDIEELVPSIKKHIERLKEMNLTKDRRIFDTTVMHAIYGASDPTKAEIAAAYERHYQNSKSLDNVLIFDVRDGWGPLCEFVQVKEPPFSFPHIK